MTNRNIKRKNIFCGTKTWLSCIFLVLGFPAKTSMAQVGESFPLWTEGYLDIHHINTGRGDAAFFMLPDGTTMLVDAGAHARPPGPRELKVKPNDSRTPGEWIVRYIRHMLQERKEQKLNYMLITHFHSDHMGGVFPGMRTSKSGAYQLSGITEVGELLPFDKVIDRGWPDYNWPSPLLNKDMENYRQFLQWHIEYSGVEVEQFNVGDNGQLGLVYQAEKYPQFEIRNIGANGHVWTGSGSNRHNHFPPLDSLSQNFPNENMSSIAMRISYGEFDYFTGGDLLGLPSAGSPEWHNIEKPVAKAVGPVEVNVTNHHGHFDAQNEYFIRTLRPKVHIIQSWVVNHPAPSTLSRLLSEKLYPGSRDVFSTNITEVGKIFSGSIMDKVQGQGHIVIRVDPNGDTFNVFILDDSEENFKIKGIYGPYSSEQP